MVNHLRRWSFDCPFFTFNFFSCVVYKKKCSLYIYNMM